MAHKRNIIGLAVAAAFASLGPFAVLADDFVTPADIGAAPNLVKANFSKVANLRQYYAKPTRFGAVRMSESARGLFTGSADEVLVWKLFDDVRLSSYRTVPVAVRENGAVNWVGALSSGDKIKGLEATPANIVVATFDRNHVYARFVVDGRIFQLVPLGDRYHAVIEVDPAQVPEYRDQMDPGGGDPGTDEPDEPSEDAPGAQIPQTEPQIPPGSGCSMGPTTRATVDIGIAYTEEAANHLPAIDDSGSATAAPPGMRDVTHFSTYLIGLTQTTFDKSQVHITARLAGIAVFPHLEGTAYSDTKALFSAIRKAPAPSGLPPAPTPIPAWRASRKADLAVLITTLDTYPIGTSFVKVGGLSPGRDSVLNRENGYSLVVDTAADANLSFQHELGHHFGAAHDPQWARYPRFSYGMGYREFCKWRTIMAYADKEQCPTGVVRYGVWSSCALKVDGVIAGSRSQNNVRLLNQKAQIVSDYYP